MGLFELYNELLQIPIPDPNDAGEVLAYCSLHDDSTPSFYFNVNTGLWYCHGCENGGPVEKFLELSGFTKEEAVEKVRAACAPVSEDVIKKWCAQLQKSPTAKAFLASRGITNFELLAKLKVGYDGDRITVPIISVDGSFLNVRRILVNRPPGVKITNKIINLPGYGNNRYIWPVDVLEGHNPIYLCAGEIDVLTALQQGVPAITGTSGEGYWEDSWSELFKDKTVIICYDGDDPGRKGALKAANSLSQHALVKIAELPDGEDVNSLHLKGIKITDLPVKDCWPSDPEGLIEALPENLSRQETDAWVDAFLTSLEKESAVNRERLIKVASKRLNTTVKVLREQLEFKLERKATPSIPTPLTEPRKVGISLAQDYCDGVHSYGVYLPTNTGEFLFRIIDSKRDLHNPPEDRGLPSDTPRWSVDSVTPYNVFSWLNKQTTPINTPELQQEIERVFRRFMWFPDEFSYTFLSLWVMVTYVFMVFDTMPYLALISTKGSGKSRTLDLIGALGFNATKAGSTSAASLYREVESDRATILFDEGDVLAAAMGKTEGVDDRQAIILDGYKRSGKVKRYDVDAKRIQSFSSYSPKAFASMFGLHEAVKDRAVVLHIIRKRAEDKLDSLIFSKEDRMFQVLRNKLYCWGLENAQLVAETRDKMQEAELGIFDREYEIWHSIFCIASHCSERVFDLVLRCADASKTEKRGSENVGALPAAVIQTCLYLLKYEEPEKDIKREGTWYRREEIRRIVAIMQEKPVDKISPERVSGELRRTGIIGDLNKYSHKIRRGDHKNKWAYLLEFDKVLDAAKRFDVPDPAKDAFDDKESD